MLVLLCYIQLTIFIFLYLQHGLKLRKMLLYSCKLLFLLLRTASIDLKSFLTSTGFAT